jgi:hypothetical protein
MELIDAKKVHPKISWETGCKDNLLLLKLRLFASLPLPPCQDTLNWRSPHWDEAIVGMKNGSGLDPPASPGMAKKAVCL